VDLHYPAHGILQLFRIEAEGTRLALVRYVAGRIDQVKAIGPCRVRLLGRVSEFIQYSRNVDSQFADAGAGDESTFLFAPWTGEDNFIFDVTLHLPDVAGMRLGDVDHQECDLAAVLLIELVKGRNLPPEGRSGIASKYEHDRLSLSGKR